MHASAPQLPMAHWQKKHASLPITLTCALPIATMGMSTRPPFLTVLTTLSMKVRSRTSRGPCSDTPYVLSTITAHTDKRSSVGESRTGREGSRLWYQVAARVACNVWFGGASTPCGNPLARTLQTFTRNHRRPAAGQEPSRPATCWVTVCSTRQHRAHLAVNASVSPLHELAPLTYMWRDRWHVSSRQVPVDDSAVITSVQAAHAPNVHHEHGSTQHMTSTVGRDLQHAAQQDTRQGQRRFPVTTMDLERQDDGDTRM
jgi:hypothetical protein